jgi:hypothetical protein
MWRPDDPYQQYHTGEDTSVLFSTRGLTGCRSRGTSGYRSRFQMYSLRSECTVCESSFPFTVSPGLAVRTDPLPRVNNRNALELTWKPKKSQGLKVCTGCGFRMISLNAWRSA